MQTYYYNTEQWLAIDIGKAWEFFSSPQNLAVITPPEMNFKIKTSMDNPKIYEGMLIDYTVKPLLGIPLAWKTKICKVNEPYSFMDTQLKGPFRLWEHSHSFIEKDGGVLVKDQVKYQMPLGILGTLAHTLVVNKRIEGIFSYRKGVLKKLLEKNGINTH
jgi:ligand-binding SRPBCC domain-containing protein